MNSWIWATALAGLFTVTVPLVRTDLSAMRLPNQYTYGLFVWSLICAIAAAVMNGELSRFLAPLLTGVAVSVGLFVSGVIAGGGVGLGDVKLVAGTSVVLALHSWQTAFLAIALAFILMAVRAVFAITKGHATFASRLPFGPAILAGAWLSVVFAIASDF